MIIKIILEIKMNNIKRSFILLFVSVISTSAYAQYGFDRMRCKGDLVDKGYTYEKVIELCGQPISERNWGNQYMTKKWYIFKSEVGSATYFMYFENGYLLESTMAR
jgi:hypothetical protein